MVLSTKIQGANYGAPLFKALKGVFESICYPLIRRLIHLHSIICKKQFKWIWSNCNWIQFLPVSKKLESVGRVTDEHRRLLGTREAVRVARGGSRVGL